MLTGKILVGIATGAVAIVLMIGLYSLYRGGDFARTHSNKLMRLRVLLQAIAILIIMVVIAFTSHSTSTP
ncbi:MAG: twin transmembrane helix small protein [Alphaproteobacteria bacterium]|nr:twin transmembrane helix small protein [Alphaproteobacteria bacterium]